MRPVERRGHAVHAVDAHGGLHLAVADVLVLAARPGARDPVLPSLQADDDAIAEMGPQLHDEIPAGAVVVVANAERDGGTSARPRQHLAYRRSVQLEPAPALHQGDAGSEAETLHAEDRRGDEVVRGEEAPEAAGLPTQRERLAEQQPADEERRGGLGG